MNNMNWIIISLIVALALIFVPIVLIWSLNTLFPLSIPLTFKTWMAAQFISILVWGYR